ncbi:UNVERIFIED_CONTAM: hypothetical protein FKN15_053343 [Acipenser sinensis]
MIARFGEKMAPPGKQVTIPEELPEILKAFTKAAIRTQPADIVRWSALYFTALANGQPLPIKSERLASASHAEFSIDHLKTLHEKVTTKHKGLDRCAALFQGILQTEKSVEKVNLFSSTNPVMKEKRSLNTAQSPNGQLVFISVPQPSTEAQPALSDDVQTQMSVLNCQAAKHGAPPTQPVYAGADSGKQSSSIFNRRLTTSTPALSPQHSANPLCIPTSVSNDIYSHGSPQGGMNYFPEYAGQATAVPSMQPAHTTPAVFTSPPPAVSSGNEVQDVLQQLYGTEAGLGQSNHQLLKEQELLRHLSHLQQQEVDNRQPAVPISSQTRIQLSSEESESEHSEGTSSEVDDLDCVDITPVKDTSCQTIFDNQRLLKTKKMSPEQTKKKVTTVKYLLGELKARVADQADSEVHRLITGGGECVLATYHGWKYKRAEIALALQPQRSENAQLRRRLRIVNQQLKERERAEKESRSVDCNFEIISLQSMNMTLQTQLKEAHRSVELLQKKNEELLKVIDQREKNKQLLTVMQEKRNAAAEQTAVHLFLSTLETDQWGSSPVNTASSNKNSNLVTLESIYCYSNGSAGTPWNKGSTIASSKRFSPSNQGSITRQAAESESDACFTLCDKPKLDETTSVRYQQFKETGPRGEE